MDHGDQPYSLLQPMAPFEFPNAIVSGFKEKAEALVAQGMHLETPLFQKHLTSS
jgi:hypothetical protein